MGYGRRSDKTHVRYTPYGRQVPQSLSKFTIVGYASRSLFSSGAAMDSGF